MRRWLTIWGGWTAMIASIAAVTLSALVLGNGNPVVTLAPVIALGLFYAMWNLPLRLSAVALLFLVLALESPGERPAMGLWESPLHPLGAVLLGNLNLVTGIKALGFSGADLIIGFLFLVLVYRKVTHCEIDGPSSQAVNPVLLFGWLSIAAVAFVWSRGLLSGGNFGQSLWQVQKLLYLPLMLIFFYVAFRGSADLSPIARAVVSAACVKACMGIWVRTQVAPPPDGWAFVTSHADSMLFVVGWIIPFSLLLERPTKRAVWRCAAVMPLLTVAMIINHRRLVWVELAAVLLCFLAVMRRSPMQRRLMRLAVLAVCLSPLYLAVGWSSTSSLFRPVQTFRSVVFSAGDRSTGTRDIENFNLLWTLRSNPLIGTGFGHEYTELVKADDISQFFAQYRFIPHNSVLGLWAFGGLCGFTAFWTLFGVGLFMAARAYGRAERAADRAAALTCLATLITYSIQAYGDMGMVGWTGVFLAAPALAIAAHLAVATGAWTQGRAAGRLRQPTCRLGIQVAGDQRPRGRPGSEKAWLVPVP